MPEPRIIAFLELTPAEVLELVAQFVEQESDGIDLLHRVSIGLSNSSTEPMLTLYLPDLYRDRKLGRWIKAFEALYQQRKNRSPQPILVEGQPIPLLNYLPELMRSPVVHSYQQLANDVSLHRQVAREVEQEKLVVALGQPTDRLGDLFRDLYSFATSFQWAVTQNSDGMSCALYHIKTDEERGSGLFGAIQGGYFADCVLLNAYISNHTPTQHLVFVPQDFIPSADGLDAFVRILSAGAQLFNAAPPNAETRLLAALFPLLSAPHNGSGEDETSTDTIGDSQTAPRMGYLYSAHLAFRPDWQAVPPAPNLTPYQLFDLSATENNLNDLRAAVKDADPVRGYRLELRSSRYRDPDEDRLHDLEVQLDEIQQEMLLLVSLRTPRPRLLRFSQTQLPALAEVIASYPMNKLSRLLYGFHAVANKQQNGARDGAHALGMHYIYVHPDVEMIEIDPLILWTQPNQPPMQFWIDPLWGDSYYQGQGGVQVFVPLGLRIHPPIHSFEPSTMDQYLRDVLGEKYHGGGGVQDIARIANPLILFDGKPSKNASIDVTLLDFDQFRPLNDSTNIGFMNDNLELLDFLDTRSWIEEMARDLGVVRRSKIAEDAKDARKTFNDLADQAVQELASKTRQAAALVDAELKRIITETEVFAQEGLQMTNRLLELWAMHNAMESRAKGMEKAIADSPQHIAAFNADLDKLAQEIETHIAHADQVGAQRKQEVQAAIDRAVRTREELNDAVERLRQKAKSL